MKFLIELLNAAASKKLYDQKAEVIKSALKILKEKIPRARISHLAKDVIEINLLNTEESDEYERSEVQDDLVQQLLKEFNNIKKIEHSDRSIVGTKRSLSNLRIGLSKDDQKILAFDLAWVNPARSKTVIDQEQKITGIGNEILFCNELNNLLESPTDVIITSASGESITIKGVIKAEHVGLDKKLTDVILHCKDEDVHLSIKKRGFREIRSAAEFLKDDTYLGIIELALNELHDSGDVAISKGRNEWAEFYHLDENGHEEVAIELSGSDIKNAYLKDGQESIQAVLVESFSKDNMRLLKNKIEISCQYLITEGSSIPKVLSPFIRAKVAFDGVKRKLKVGGHELSMRFDIIPRFNIKQYKREHIHTKKQLPEKTKVIKL